jgi:putative ABC transport system ATP-binding protein
MVPMLSLEDIGLMIGDGIDRRWMFNGLSLGFGPGQFHCLSGPSGSGKTTILSMLAGIVIPERGSAVHAGVRLSELTPAARQTWRTAAVALAFQTNRLIDILSVAEHLALVARIRNDAVAEARGHDWLARFGLADKLGHRPGQLSGGEKARVALAQALAAATPLLFADEPTAALDSTNAAFVARTLRGHAETSGTTVVAVSHDRAMIDMAHQSVVLGKA